MDGSRNKGLQDRSKINMHDRDEVQYWTKHLKVSNEELLKAVEKVGNAAAAVRKELAHAKPRSAA
jgi:hypothetical protein